MSRMNLLKTTSEKSNESGVIGSVLLVMKSKITRDGYFEPNSPFLRDIKRKKERVIDRKRKKERVIERKRKKGERE